MNKPNSPPKYLGKLGKQAWNHLYPRLLSAGLLSDVAEQLLGTVCQEWQNYRISTETVAKDGAIITTKTGILKPHPAVGVASTAFKNYCSGLRLLGIEDAVKIEPVVEPPGELDIFIAKGLAEDAEAQERFRRTGTSKPPGPDDNTCPSFGRDGKIDWHGNVNDPALGNRINLGDYKDRRSLAAGRD